MFCVAQHSYLPRYGSFSWENSNKLSVGPHIVLLLTGLILRYKNLRGWKLHTVIAGVWFYSNILFMDPDASGVKSSELIVFPHVSNSHI